MPRDDWDWEVQEDAVAGGDIPRLSAGGLSGLGYTQKYSFYPAKGERLKDFDWTVKGICPQVLKEWRKHPERHSLFTENNTLRLWTYSQSRLSCSPSPWCEKYCYAGVVETLESGAKRMVPMSDYAWATTQIPHFMNLCIAMQSDFSEIVIDYLKAHKGIKVMRIFSEGDFHSVANVEAWERIAAAFPDRWFTFYTRKWRLGAEWRRAIISLSSLDNVTMQCSWDPSLEPESKVRGTDAFPRPEVLRVAGLAVAGLDPRDRTSLRRIEAAAKKAGTQLVFCPKNLSKMCAAEVWQGMSCKECRWCYGNQKQPWVFYLLHGLSTRCKAGDTQCREAQEELLRLDWELGRRLVAAGRVPTKYTGVDCSTPRATQSEYAGAHEQQMAAWKAKYPRREGESPKNYLQRLRRMQVAEASVRRRAMGLESGSKPR